MRARLDPEQWAKAYAAGRKASIDALLKDIDHVLRGEAHSIESRRVTLHMD